VNVAGMRGSAGAGPDDEPTRDRDRWLCEADVVDVLVGVDDADVDDVVIEVVGVVAAGDEACFELPQAPSRTAATVTARDSAESLTFPA
jgi:hypothetical protein